MAYQSWEDTPGAALARVTAYTRHLAGPAGFGTARYPTLDDAERFLQDAFAETAVVLAGAGYATAQTGVAVRAYLVDTQAVGAAIRLELTSPSNTLTDENNARYMALQDRHRALLGRIEAGDLDALGADRDDLASPGIAATGLSRARKGQVYQDADAVPARFPRGFGRHPGAGRFMPDQQD